MASAPDFSNPASKDEISVWVMLETEGSSGDAEAKGNEVPDLEEPGSNDSPVEETADETAGGGSISSDPTLTEDEAAILGDLQSEFEDVPETPLFSDDDIAAMMKAEEASSGEEPDFASSAASSEEEDSSSDEQLDEADEDDSEFGGPRVYPAVEVGVITTEKLEIVDADGKPRTVLSTLRDGSPYLSIADATGRIRATLRLDEEGDARLTFVDEMGSETWMAPRDEPPPPAREPEAPRKRIAPAPAPAPKKSKSPGPGTNGKKPRPRRDARPARRKLSADGKAPKGPGRRKVKVAAKKPSRTSAARTTASR